MTLDLNPDHLCCLCVCHILSGFSGCIISHIHEDTCIRLSGGITLSIHGLQNQGQEIVSQHGIQLMRLNLLCYLLLCSILHPA